MEVEFRNNRLRSCYHDERRGAREWNRKIAERYIRVVKQVVLSETLEDLQRHRSLQIHKLIGDRAGGYALRLDYRWRMEFEYDADRDTVLIKEVSLHYGD